ncbi:MAG: hypothetical protein R3C59_16105 [Planctomycetaceae bacterium]
MKTAEDNLPKCGNQSKELGVRVAPNPHPDVDVTPDGIVELNERGMSVGRHWSALPGHLIPKRLTPIFPGATGANSISCFRLGDGEFAEGPVSDKLRLRMKTESASLGLVVPVEEVSIEEFQTALCNTRSDWVIDED